MNKRYLLFGLIGLGIVGGLTLSIYTTFHGDEKDVSTQQAQQQQQHETATPTPTLEPSEETQNPVSTPTPAADDLSSKYEKPPETQKRVIGLGEIKELENRVREQYRNLKFMDGVDVLSSQIQSIEQNDGGRLLQDLYEDGSMLANITPASSEDSQGETVDIKGIKTIFANIHDPEDALVGLFLLSEDDRNEVIVNKDSLNPIYNESVRIMEKADAPEDMVNQVHKLHPEMKVTRIQFEIEGYQLDAFVMTNPQGYSQVYMIKEVVEGQTPYKTIMYWYDLKSKLNANK